MSADHEDRRAYFARSLPMLEQAISELDRHELWAVFLIDCDNDRGRQFSELAIGRSFQAFQGPPVAMASSLAGHTSAKLSHQVCKTCTLEEAHRICARGLPELSLPDVADGCFLAIVVHNGAEAFVLPTLRVPDDLPDLDSSHLSPQIVKLLPAKLCREREILPLDWRDGELYVAAAKWDESVIEMVSFTLCGQPKIRLAIRSREAILRAIEKYFGPDATG
ncbi:MAG: hypothetical protein WD845_18170 [Pirellulales bacterium]